MLNPFANPTDLTPFAADVLECVDAPARCFTSRNTSPRFPYCETMTIIQGKGWGIRLFAWNGNVSATIGARRVNFDSTEALIDFLCQEVEGQA